MRAVVRCSLNFSGRSAPARAAVDPCTSVRTATIVLQSCVARLHALVVGYVRGLIGPHRRACTFDDAASLCLGVFLIDSHVCQSVELQHAHVASAVPTCSAVCCSRPLVCLSAWVQIVRMAVCRLCDGCWRSHVCSASGPLRFRAVF